MTINVEPNLDHKLPTRSRQPKKAETFPDKAKVAGNTAILLQELGATFEMDAEDHAQAGKLFEAIGKQDHSTEEELALDNPSVALGLAKYINDYEKQIVQDKIQVRNIVTNRLLQMSSNEDPRIAIKALELLGKSSDLFTEHSEITITHKTSDELKEAIKERIRVLMQATTIDVTPKAERLAQTIDVEATEVEKDA